MKSKNKQIIEAVIIFLVIFAAGILVHELFLKNLEYGILRSFIVAAGVTLGRYMAIRKKSAQLN